MRPTFPPLRRLPWAALGLILWLAPTLSHSFGFGSNKVRNHTDHHWKYIESDHFQVYYYDHCEALAQTAAKDAEEAFRTTCRAFDFVPKNRIPLFIYATPLEFAETNITPQILGEGVGGFTEVFKNRIAVPMDGSYHEFEKVVHHEITHAFQYDLIYGEGWRSVNLFKAVFVPNWMMEGMAEWNSRHLDPLGEMVLRDGLLNDQVLPLSLMESFDHFPQVYMAYKESQSILDYITQIYGADKVSQLFKRMASNQPPDAAVKSLLGISLDELYEHWRFYLRSKAWARIEGMPAPERYGEKMTEGVSKAAVSPDGKKIALVKASGLVLWDVAEKRQETVLNRHLATQGSGVAWSPSGGELAFCVDRDGEYRLCTFSIADRKLTERPIAGFPVVNSPAWSPDGRYLLVSGFDYHQVDLLRYELSTGKAERLTNDLATESWAGYSPDQKTLYFIQESEGLTRILAAGLDGDGLPRGTPRSLGRDLGYLSSLKVFQDHLDFTSNRSKAIFNLYRLDLPKGSLTQLTNGFTDLLNAAPAPDESVFYANIYQKASEALYRYPAANLERMAEPPFTGTYLCDDFSGASKLFPDSTKDLPKENLASANEDKDQPEVAREKPPVNRAPFPVSHLDVAESTNLVQLLWPVSSGEADNVDSYRVYRSANAEGPFTQVANLTNLRQGRYVDYNVEDGKTYHYYVTATNKTGESEPSPQAEAHPVTKSATKDYSFGLTPDILLFLAGYDSSFGFVGGGILQMSDYLGDHRIGFLGDTIPGVRTGLEANYEFSQWRTTVDLDFYYYQNYFNIYDLSTGSIVNEYRNNENGFALNFSYPFSTDSRFEYGLGTQRFLGSPVYLQFSEGISNYSQSAADQWNVANYYRLAFVQDRRVGTQFWPSSGYALNLTLLHAPTVLDSTVSFANLMMETQVFADIGFLNHLVWANRFIAMTSQGRDPQSFFIGNDAPFQAFFTTLRGYGGSTFFGSNLGLFNMELRYPLATNMDFIPHPLSFLLIKDLELAGFLDVGVVSNQLSDIPQAPVLSSIGTGLRFYTFAYQRALVLLRFDVAWRLDQSAPPSFHFNLVPIF